MTAPSNPGRLVEGFGSDRFRVRIARKGDAPAVKVELVQPIASHAPDVLMPVGKALFVPLDRISALIEALDAAKRETMEAPLCR